MTDATTTTNPTTDDPNGDESQWGEEGPPREVKVISHSSLLYWWPVWLIGFVFAAITYVQGNTVPVGEQPVEMFASSTNLGMVYIGVLLATLLFTNVVMRGLVAGIVVIGLLFIVTLFALLGWWDGIYAALPDLTVHMNFGFYMITSSVIFVLWALTVFLFDRLAFWRVRAGQVTYERLIGGGETSYDTSGIQFREHHDDPFRHYALGIGSGDIDVTVRNPQLKQFHIRNVLFANKKVEKIQWLIRRRPE